MVDSVTFLAHLEELPAMMQWARSCIASLPFSAAEVRRIELSLEEALINIIQHAYVKGSQGSLTLRYVETPSQGVTFTIIDQGKPFNPLSHKLTQTHIQKLHERKEGGLGIFLMIKMMDHITYERKESHNILTLYKNIPQRSSHPESTSR